MTLSPNHNARTVPVSCIVLHADAASDVKASLDWCCRKESKVSYHVLIGRDGTTFHLVDPDRRAWHAGVSTFQGKPNVNDFSIGLSFSNKNDGIEPYTEAQLDVAAALCKEWMQRYGITKDRVTTHALIAPGRKTDPKGLDLAAFKARL